MSKHLLPIYLKTHRLRHGFAQRELAFLLETSGSVISKIELRASQPSIRIAIGSELLFGEFGRDLFPALYEQIEGGLQRRAKLLLRELKREENPAAVDKIRLLEALVREQGS